MGTSVILFPKGQYFHSGFCLLNVSCYPSLPDRCKVTSDIILFLQVILILIFQLFLLHHPIPNSWWELRHQSCQIMDQLYVKQWSTSWRKGFTGSLKTLFKHVICLLNHIASYRKTTVMLIFASCTWDRYEKPRIWQRAHVSKMHSSTLHYDKNGWYSLGIVLYTFCWRFSRRWPLINFVIWSLLHWS